MKKVMPVEQKANVDKRNNETETELGVLTAADDSSPRDLHSLREIIFGPLVREYAAKFRAIDGELERLEQASEERYVDLSAKLDQKFAELSDEIHKKLRELDKQINDRVEQAASKGESDLRKISTLFDNLAQELREKLEKVTHSQASQLSELREQLKRNYDTLRSELVAETDALDERKLNRYAIAESLIELGMRLKDKNPLNELNTPSA
jgi:vacuolar-type H+-ATPase subunit I/STV1